MYISKNRIQYNRRVRYPFFNYFILFRSIFLIPFNRMHISYMTSQDTTLMKKLQSISQVTVSDMICYYSTNLLETNEIKIE
jgi:hypothetical protein